LQQYQMEHHCKNLSQTISSVLVAYSRLQLVISKLEAEAWKAEEGKKKQVGTGMKHTTAPGVKKSTDSKVILAKNTLGSRKQGGKH